MKFRNFFESPHTSFSLRGFVFSMLRIGILVYFGFGVILFFFQRDFLYFPSGSAFGVCEDFTLAEALTLPDGARAYYTRVSKDRVAVVYHGNAGNACDRALYAQFFRTLGYSSLVVEYAGYGGDVRGEPSATRILNETKEVARFVESEQYETVAVVGMSLGASVAAYHSTHQEPEYLVLINPAVSVEKRAQELYPLYPARLILREKYDTLGWARMAPNARITIIHAGNDTLIPPHHGKELFEKLPQEEKRLVIVPGAEHNTLIAYPLMWETLTEALQ